MRREKHAIPVFVMRALEDQGVMAAYEARPAYQQNDYVGWIKKAKNEATKRKRVFQMVEELKAGGIYMNVDHPPSKRG